MKKLFAFVLSLVMVLSLCVACGVDQPDTTATNGGGEGGGSDKISLTIGMKIKATVLDYEDNAMTKWVEEQTGFDLTFLPYSGGEETKTQIATTISAGKPLPDILFGISLGTDVVNQYGQEGYLVDLTPYLEDRDGKSKVFWERFESVYTEDQQEEILAKMKDPDTGKIFAMPSMDTSLVDPIDYMLWINTEWLDKLGLPMPTDRQSLYDTLVAFRDGDPNGNGQKDEIPLYGAQEGGRGADVINWLVNMFVYMDDIKTFNVDEDNQLYTPFTTDEYREALKFINKLIKEGLMLDTAFTAGMADVKPVTTPASGTAMCGIFAGHLTLHADYNNPVMKQYQPLPLWSQVVIHDHNLSCATYITADCKNPDAAFELFMTLYSEPASIRLRYGEYGANWTDPDEGAVSPYGIPAKIKIIRDPLMEQNYCLWSGVSCTLAEWSEGEAAQMSDKATEGEILKAQMHAKARELIDEAVEKYNPAKELMCPSLTYTAEEKEIGDTQRTACVSYYRQCRTDFCTGQLNPNSDADWQTYLDTLEDMGIEDWLTMAQLAYDRMW